MKHLITLISVLFALAGLNFAQARTATVPEEGQAYNIKQAASGYYLTRGLGNDAPIIKLATANYDQQFQFIETAAGSGIYNIFCIGYDEYLARKDGGNGWTMFWTIAPNDPNSWPLSTAENKLLNAQWQIIDKGDYVLLKNLASNAYLGTDDRDDGAPCYANKGETAENSKWFISEATGEVDKIPLQKKYDEAKALYDATREGTAPNQYPASTRAALRAALTTAEDVLENDGAFMYEVNDAISDLTAVLSAYKASVYPFQPSATITYYIQHSGGCYFTGNSIAIAPDQYFTFVAVGGNYYNIKNSAGEFLTRSDNGYDLIWTTDGTVTTTHFIIRSIRPVGTDYYYTIQCAALTGDKAAPAWFLGTDYDTPAGAYIDKDGKDEKHYWKIFNIDDVEVVKTALEEAVAKVEEFLQYAVKGNGADQYPETEYDALTAAKSAAQTVINNNNATQTDVSAATSALNNALAACIAAVKPLNPDPAKRYNIIHYSGLFLNALDFSGYEEGVSKPNGINIAAESDADNQKIKFVAVPDATGVYNITVASVAEKYLIRCTDPHATEAEKFDDHKLIWGDDAASPYAKFEMKRIGNQNYYTIKCITVGPQRTNSYAGTDAATEGSGISIDKDGKSTNHYWTIVEEVNTAIPNIIENNVSIYSDNGILTVANLEGINKISIYSITGQLISTQKGVSSQYTKQLPQGVYLVVVDGTTLYRGKAVVR
jgi:hypothetical protein